MKTQILKFFDTRKFLWIASGVLGIIAVTFLAMSARAASSAVITSAVHDQSETIITRAPIGTIIHDTVIVATSTNADPLPTGTVDFNLYANTACSGTATTTEAGVALINGLASSTSTILPNTGLSYKVHYNGQNNVYSPSDSPCESVIATASSTVLTTTLSTTTAVLAGSIIHDSATLSNVTSDASGTVTYTIYSNSICTLGKVGAGIGTVTAGVVSDSSPLQFNFPGTYYFQAVYSGDVNNDSTKSICGSENLTVLSTSTPPAESGHIIVDKVTVPSGDPKSFQFNATGAGYGSFALTDLAAPNNQTLVPGVYKISEAFVFGWSLASSSCVINSAAPTAYVPGSNLTLNSGDTIICTFTNIKQATTTKIGDRDKDDDGFFNRFKNFFKRFSKHDDNGRHEGQIKNGNNGNHDNNSNNGKKHENEDRDEDRDDD